MRLARSYLLLLALCLIAPASAFALSEPTLTLSATSAEFDAPVQAMGTLAAGTAPTGFISFSAYAPDDPTCASSPVFTDSVPVNDNGTYPSGNFTPTGAGTFHWSASYSGDGENAPAEAICAASSVITKATTGIGTTATSGTVGAAISDSATISGGVSPGGQLTFKAFGPADPTCALPPAFEVDVPVSGSGNYGSGNFVPGTAGSYNWTASYSGDEDNLGAISGCGAANETSTVAKASPGLVTTATSATVGAAISDSATLSAGVTPTGTITFKAFGPNDATCALAPAFEVSVPVTDNGTFPSGNFTTTAAGTYLWTAAYSGDANNNAASSPCNAANETSTVAKASPSLVTTATSATVGAAISDSATLSAGVTPTGTIVFKAFGPNDATCALAPAFEVSVPVNSGNGAYPSGPFTTTAAGSYRWTAAYSGDANNNAASSPCNAANETSMVAKASPGLVTTATSATVGAAISDSATLSAGVTPTGTITFKAFGPNDATCALAPAFEVSVPVNSGNGTYPSGNFTPTVVGSYRWTAAYPGDANNNAASSGCNAANETSTVAKATPAISTTATSAPFGFAIGDSASITAGFSPTGSITFKAFGPNDATCAKAAAFQATVPINGNSSYASGDFNGAQLGTYRWTVAYPGDANNNAASSPCNAANETSTVGDANPTLTTSAASAEVGSPISDSATIAGGFNPTGQLTFKAFGPSDSTCSNAPLFTSNVTVAGNGAYNSGGFIPLQLGTYRWTVTYPGDTNNNPAPSSVCASAAGKASVVSKAAPVLPSAASGSAIGSSIADIVTFGGGFQHTGQIVFRAYAPEDAACAGAPAFATTVDVTPGNGTYASGAFAPNRVGSYRWTTSYSGDALNNAAASACNAANSTSNVTPAVPAIAARVSAATAPIGTKEHDSATLSGAFQPTGTITFRLFGPGDTNCSSPPVFTDTAPVTANGTLASAAIAPAAPGQYRFVAAYSGDAANGPAASACAATAQVLTVNKRTPSLSARASLRGARKIAARANLTGAAAPKGKITFQIFGPDNSRCSGKPAFSQRVSVHGGGSYQPAVFRPRAAGLYRLTVAYAGDAWNKPTRSGCNAAGQSIRVGSK